MSSRVVALVDRTARRDQCASVHRFSALVHHAQDAVLLLGRDHRIVYANPAFDVLCGAQAPGLGDHVGTRLEDYVDQDQRAAMTDRLRSLARAASGALVAIECRHARPDGDERVLEGSARNLLDDPGVRAIVVTLCDATERRRLERELEWQAYHDPLTGLANRTRFRARLDAALREGDETGDRLAVMFIDLDGFKAINDGMGHDAGDALLRMVAERLRRGVRPEDTVARLGGDEFAVLLEHLDSVEQAHALAGRVLQSLREPMEVLGADLVVAASVGLVPRTDQACVDTLLRDADLAMYAAKSAGKGRVAVFDDRLRRAAERHLQLRIDLPHALHNGEMRLVYQPIFGLREQEQTGFEALVRWEHPERGLLRPEEFLSVAEESGFIVDLGRWILREACHHAGRFNTSSARPLTMAVNVSGVQLSHPTFLADLEATLHATGLAPELLTIEITESVLVDAAGVRELLRSLHALGVRIAIDDFGTGYSSLAYLQQLPVSCVKIDRGFIVELGAGGNPAMVRSILAMAGALGIATVAEGVETVEELRLLEELDCRSIQGYLLGEPQSPADISDRIPFSHPGGALSRAAAPVRSDDLRDR